MRDRACHCVRLGNLTNKEVWALTCNLVYIAFNPPDVHKLCLCTSLVFNQRTLFEAMMKSIGEISGSGGTIQNLVKGTAARIVIII